MNAHTVMGAGEAPRPSKPEARVGITEALGSDLTATAVSHHRQHTFILSQFWRPRL